MKGFVQHEPCPQCNSKDNLARYADGGAWCFGCHYRERSTSAPRAFLERKGGDIPSEVSGDENPAIPEDSGTSFSESAVAWLGKFHLDIPTAIRRGVLYSPSRDQIIYQFGNVWQARKLNPGLRPDGKPKSKNFTSGNVNESTHIYGVDSSTRGLSGSDVEVRASSLDRVLVLVEDPVSAIRISSLSDSMPLLGSYLATRRLNALAGLYNRLVVWLDSDKLKESRNIAERAGLIGIDVRVIYTELDPKCYTLDELREILDVPSSEPQTTK